MTINFCNFKENLPEENLPEENLSKKESSKKKSSASFIESHRGPVVFNVSGLELNAEDERRLQHPAAGGIILFARHYATLKQLEQLILSIRAQRPDILIAVDQEGGRVQRFRTAPFTVLPAMALLGELAQKKSAKASRVAHAVGYVLASELRALDIDLSFTPVLDRNMVDNAVIGRRAFDSNVEIISSLATALITGLAQAGLANCGKHFPGHGFAKGDTHHVIAEDNRNLNDLLADALPYRLMNVMLDAVMAAHVVYPQVDHLPAGFSKIWLQTYLRQYMKFSGAIFSDDLSMAGARVAGDVVKGARLAMAAGCDMVIVCNDFDAINRVLDGLYHDDLSHYFNGPSPSRISRLLPHKPIISFEALQTDVRYQTAREIIQAAIDT